MLFAILLYLYLFLSLFLGLDCLYFFVVIVDNFNLLSILHVLGPSLPLLLLFLAQGSLSLELQELSLLHFIFVLVDVLLDDLLVLLLEVLLEFLIFDLFLLLDPPLLLVALPDLVLSVGGSTMVYSW